MLFYYRYMSKEQIIKKLENEKKMRMHETYERKKIMNEMYEMDKDDHIDLKKIFTNINKKEIPHEMSLFWEEQHKILTTESKSQYRWHPRYMKEDNLTQKY